MNPSSQPTPSSYSSSKLSLLTPQNKERPMLSWENITVKDLTEKLSLVYKVSARCEIDPSKINFRALEGAVTELITASHQYKERAGFYRRHRRKKGKMVTTSPRSPR